MSALASIQVETSHGSYVCPGDPSATIAQVLRHHGIPATSVWTFVQARNQSGHGKTVKFVHSGERLGDVVQRFGRVFARVSRNINIEPFLADRLSPSRNVADASTDWVFASPAGGFEKPDHRGLSPTDCRAVVNQCVRDVFAMWPGERPKRLIVGVSGGGDSNALLTAILDTRMFDRSMLFPTMMLGIPDWDQQQQAAEALCRHHSLELDVVEAEDAARLAGVRSLPDLLGAFARKYPDVDREFLGTWLLRRVLSAKANERNATAVAIGANREDLLSEGLARLAIGRAPLPAPFRPIGDVTFVYPMWMVPKKIGDGAYPTYSLANYEMRAPSYTSGRSLFYFLAYLLADSAPGLDASLVEGFAKLSSQVASPIASSGDDCWVSDGCSQDVLHEWQTFIRTCASEHHKNS